MRCIQFPSLRPETGSAVTGFALAAPLVVCVFMVVIQIGSVLADRATLLLAAQSGVRVASTLDGTDMQGRSKVMSVLASRHMESGTTIMFKNELRGSMHYVVCITTTRRHLSWLNTDITITTKARAIDEARL